MKLNRYLYTKALYEYACLIRINKVPNRPLDQSAVSRPMYCAITSQWDLSTHAAGATALPINPPKKRRSIDRQPAPGYEEDSMGYSPSGHLMRLRSVPVQ